jgi:hypothetical protein
MIGSIMKLQNKMVNIRLLWTLLNIRELTEALKSPDEKDDILFGTLDSWLIFKLSGEKKLHVSSISNSAATGNCVLSPAVTCCHQLSPDVTSCHQLSPAVILLCNLPSPVLVCCRLSYLAVSCHNML